MKAHWTMLQNRTELIYIGTPTMNSRYAMPVACLNGWSLITLRGHEMGDQCFERCITGSPKSFWARPPKTSRYLRFVTALTNKAKDRMSSPR